MTKIFLITLGIMVAWASPAFAGTVYYFNGNSGYYTNHAVISQSPIVIYRSPQKTKVTYHSRVVSYPSYYKPYKYSNPYCIHNLPKRNIIRFSW